MHEPELHRAIPVDQENFDNLIAGMVNGCGMEITRFSPWFDVIYDDITSILGPTLAYKKAVLREYGENPWLDSDQYILKMATERAVNLVKVASIVTEELGGFFREDTDVGGSKKAFLRGQISRLSSDTHNGGFSPLHLNNGTEQVVVKFSDPKPYELWNDVVALVGRKLGICLERPIIKKGQRENWYMTKFLENKFGKDHEVNRFMYSFGAVIAVACTLMVTDAHLENIVVDQGIPVLVDPECMPYPVFSASPQIRLFRTGLVSNDANYSALLGGGRSMRNSRGQVSEGGVFSYLHQSKNLRNRFIFSNGSEADPREFKRDIIMGFSDAYQVLLSNIGDINEIMGRYLTQDYRTRIVVRATRHYTSILEMLKLPQVQDYRTWKSAVLEKFAKSGSYIGTTTQMIHAEISDLEIGDVPFFWFNMRDRRLHHRNGIISDLRPEAFNSTQRDFYCNIKEDEHDVLIDCLTAFLAEN